MSCFLFCFGRGDDRSSDAQLKRDGSRKCDEWTRDELKEIFRRSIQVNNGRLIVHGIFARADTKNNNKRVYPKYVLQREVARYEKEHIQGGTALGELDHPNYASRYFKNLNLPNISHQVLEVRWKGDCLWGTIEILPTPSGLLLWELYSQGIKLGVSSRGWASLRTDPKTDSVIVDDDFELITFDFVTEPSTKDAYLVPLDSPYRMPVPSQIGRVQIAYCGHGMCGMELVKSLPEPAMLSKRVNQLQAQFLGQEPRSAGLSSLLPADGFNNAKLMHLDKLLMHSHYIVFQDAPYIEREANARDLHSHLAMFATRAHLAGMQEIVKKKDMSEFVMQEMTRGELVDESSSYASSSGSGMAGKEGGVDLRPGQAPPPSPYVQGASSSEARNDHYYTKNGVLGGRGDFIGLGEDLIGGPVASPPSHEDAADASYGRHQHNTPPQTAGGSMRLKPRSNRIQPEPGGVGSRPEAVQREFQLIRATLASYSRKVRIGQLEAWELIIINPPSLALDSEQTGATITTI